MLRFPGGRTGRLRLRALLLLGVFLGAGTTLPSLDALMHHWGRSAPRAERHLEPAGGCVGHAEHCNLGRTAPGTGAVQTMAAAVRIEPSARPQRFPTPAIPLIAAYRGATTLSRAPPAHLA